MMEQQLTHGALFNGIAGFPLAAAWAGIHTEWTVEIDQFCNQVSKKHFPDAIQYTDIHHATKLPYVDIISGGFPCQPYSVAGKQLGNEDDRALWPEMLRIIREVKPAYVIGENVAGLINLALDDVLASLEAEGYTTETFVVPACAVNAPHRRDRLWIIGYTKHNGLSAPEIGQGFSAGNGRSKTRKGKSKQPPRPDTPESVVTSNTYSQQRCERRMHPAEPETAERYAGPLHARGHERSSWNKFPTQPPLCNGNDGIPAELDGITFSKWRNESIKAGGNAIVPQVAFQIFQAIKAMHTP